MRGGYGQDEPQFSVGGHEIYLRIEPMQTLFKAILWRNENRNRLKMRTVIDSVKLDAIDEAILVVLQSEGKVSNLELSERVHLSPSACLRRVKALEESGVIDQYVALVNPKAVGQPGTSFTIVNLEKL